jgi:hypothetical protein
VYTFACRMARWAAIAIWTAAALNAVPEARASDLDLSWRAPPDCSDRERVREALSRKVGREVTLGSDAPLSLSGSIAAESGGYELELETRSPNGSEERRLQARSCGELVRASVLIAALLLSEGPGWSESAPGTDEDGPRDWFMFVRARAIGDFGSLAPFSLGAGLSIGLRLHRTRLELGGAWLPPREVSAEDEPRAGGTLQLAMADLAVCQEFFAGPTLAPCLKFELGQISGRGKDLAADYDVSTTWLMAALGARGSVGLFGPMFMSADISAGLPLRRPTFAIRGAGTVHEVPAVVGRVELSVEGRF